MMYPRYNQVYTLTQILNELKLDDSPFLNFEHEGRKGVIQSSSCSDAEMLAIPHMADSQWRYSRTTDEMCPIFYYAATNTVPITELVDLEPLIDWDNTIDPKNWWAVAKGYPRGQYVSSDQPGTVGNVLDEPEGPEQTRAVTFVRHYDPFLTVAECMEKYAIYRGYRDEGQTDIVSRQYAGLV